MRKMGFLSSLAKSITETRFFTPIGISGVTTAVRTTISPVKEVSRAVGETALATSVMFPTTALKTIAKVGTSLIPKTIIGKIGAVTGSLVGYGILKESPIARAYVSEKVVKAPGEAIGFGEDVGKVIEGEKELGGKDIVKGVAAAGVVGGLVAGGIVVGKKIAGLGKPKLDVLTPSKEKAVGVPGESAILP
jgi:hypothetical protein